jgi:uncharacterized protein
MKAVELPILRYHPDPIATGSVVPSLNVCPVCEKSRGFAYEGVPHGTIELRDVCPWCIADGSAHEKFGVEFSDPAGIGGYGQWEKVPTEIVNEVAFRTPGFAAWQQERWFTHCDDAAEFLGPMGRTELEQVGSEAIEAIRLESEKTGADWDFLFSRLDRKYNSTAYLFRCRHCGKLGGYSDCD